MKSRFFLKIFLISFCLISTGIIFCYYYFLRADVQCQRLGADAEHACYSVNLFSVIPIAYLQFDISSSSKDTKAITMVLEPIGVAMKLANKTRFQVTSTFDSMDHLPLSFAITQHDEHGLRSIKTTLYDFQQNMLHWTGYSPPGRKKKFEDEVVHLSRNVHSPLSIVYHVLGSPQYMHSNGELMLYVQAKSQIYVLRKTAQNINRAMSYNDKAGNVEVVSFSIGRDAERQEEWRRRKELGLRLFFFEPESGPKEFFPFKGTLPFRLITFNRVDSNNLKEQR